MKDLYLTVDELLYLRKILHFTPAVVFNDNKTLFASISVKVDNLLDNG